MICKESKKIIKGP